MTDIPLGFALAAGALAAVNPCGFAMLPVYAGFLITGQADEEQPPRGVVLLRALGLTAAMTVGFAAVFGAFGLLVAPFAPQLTAHLPWVTTTIHQTPIGISPVIIALWGIRRVTSTRVRKHRECHPHDIPGGLSQQLSSRSS